MRLEQNAARIAFGLVVLCLALTACRAPAGDTARPTTVLDQAAAEATAMVQRAEATAMMLEAQALDLYMRYADKSQDSQAEKMLFKMADEEKAHLKSLGELLEKKI